jgi:hypothetical protein
MELKMMAKARLLAAPAGKKYTSINDVLRNAKSIHIDKNDSHPNGGGDATIVITMPNGQEVYISADDERGRKIGWSYDDEVDGP